jgi:glycosyltransferase involved in cell wall biosynthesis
VKRLKIVIVGPVYPYRGGIAHYTARLAQELSGCHDVQVLSFFKQYPARLYPGHTDRDPSQKTIDVPAEYLLEALNPLAWWRSAAWIRREKPDLVIFQWWITFWSLAYTVLASLCRWVKIPVIFMIHNVMPHEGGRIHRPLARLTLGRGRGFIVHTEEERRRLNSLLPRAPVEVCPFPIYDMLAVPGDISREQARRQLDLPEGARILLFFGIIRAYKGLSVLLEAIGLLKAKGEVYYLIVAGEFWEEKSAYLAQMERLGISGQVRLEDRYIPNEELPAIFSAADIAVAPYVSGTQSAVVALAQGFGIPLITTDWSAAGVAQEDRSRILTVPPGDAPALAEAIQQAFREPAVTSSKSPRESGGWEMLVDTIEKIHARFSQPGFPQGV